MTGFLASVTSVEEAALAIDSADIIDLKNPAMGALGALPLSVVEEVVRFVDGRKPVSATIGDLPMNPTLMLPAAEAMASTGVDIVKVGFFEQGEGACVQALEKVTERCKLVAVLFADRSPDMRMLDGLADSRFYGVMLDTAGKAHGGLLAYMEVAALTDFVTRAKSLGLLSGLAGSLRKKDIPILFHAAPDFLGFRGALCRDHERVSSLQYQSLIEVERVLRGCNTQLPESSLQLHS